MDSEFGDSGVPSVGFCTVRLSQRVQGQHGRRSARPSRSPDSHISDLRFSAPSPKI
jgi:hypothetical protein